MQLREFTHSSAVKCAPSTTVAEAAQHMRTDNVGTVIVVNQDDSIIGIVTDRDIALRCVADELKPSTPVSAIMTKNVTWLSENANVFDAAAQMATAGCRRLPVVGVDGTLIGIVALDDLMVLFARQTDSLAQAVAGEIATTGR